MRAHRLRPQPRRACQDLLPVRLDKIIRCADGLGLEPRELAARFEATYHEDMAALHNNSVDIHARAHDYIEQIVAQVQQLIDRGHAYQKLSGRTEVQGEDSVARVDENAHKRNSGDFALWKARKPGEPYWDSPLGAGRPGWHIEDTAITEALFGPQYDLHGGAVDLIFPTTRPRSLRWSPRPVGNLWRYWLHTGLLCVDGAKMAKSADNFVTIRQALDLTDFRTLRFAFLSQHYRTSMELNSVTHDNRNARRRVENFARLIDTGRPESESGRGAGQEGP